MLDPLQFVQVTCGKIAEILRRIIIRFVVRALRNIFSQFILDL